MFYKNILGAVIAAVMVTGMVPSFGVYMANPILGFSDQKDEGALKSPSTEVAKTMSTEGVLGPSDITKDSGAYLAPSIDVQAEMPTVQVLGFDNVPKDSGAYLAPSA